MKSIKQREHIDKALNPYLPEGTSTTIASWIVDHGIQFVVAKPRQSKLGDFRPGSRHAPSRISVNGDLNPFAFLITTVHEFAHLECHNKHGRRVSPHGKEWKQLYSSMLVPFMKKEVFPEIIHKALEYHITAPSASSCSCAVLNKALAKYDNADVTFLSDLTVGSSFLFRDEYYKAIERRRTRYLCERLTDGKKYLISGRAAITLLGGPSLP